MIGTMFRGLAFLLGYRVLARFWGRERRGFFAGVRFFRGSGVFSLFSLSSSFVLLLLFWWPAWVSLLPLLRCPGAGRPGLPLPGQAGAAPMRPCSLSFCLLFLPGSAAPPSLPPSFCPLSLSLFFSLSLPLSCKHA